MSIPTPRAFVHEPSAPGGVERLPEGAEWAAATLADRDVATPGEARRRLGLAPAG